MFKPKSSPFCKDVKGHPYKTDFNIHVVLCGKEGEVFNNTLQMLQYSAEGRFVTYLVNFTIFP